MSRFARAEHALSVLLLLLPLLFSSCDVVSCGVHAQCGRRSCLRLPCTMRQVPGWLGVFAIILSTRVYSSSTTASGSIGRITYFLGDGQFFPALVTCVLLLLFAPWYKHTSMPDIVGKSPEGSSSLIRIINSMYVYGLRYIYTYRYSSAVGGCVVNLSSSVFFFIVVRLRYSIFLMRLEKRNSYGSLDRTFGFVRR